MEAASLRLISQGAEGKVHESSFLGKPSIIKERLSKRYRVKELDQKINKQRLLQEARCMVRCRKAGILTPSIFLVDTIHCQLHIQRILGRTIKDILLDSYAKDGIYPESAIGIARSIGSIIAKMHDAEVVHGDLTTSNIMIVRSSDDASTGKIDNPDDVKVVMIDFGLGNMKPIVEDKAVDLYVLERAFVSTHPDSEYLVSHILEGYSSSSAKSKATLSKLEQVRMRGRKRDMFG